MGKTVLSISQKKPIMRLKYESYVYFTEAVGRDLVKIGVSANPYTRIHNLGSRFREWELRLIGAVPGDFQEETRVHKNFTSSGARVFGEWYRYSRVAGDIEYLLPPGDKRFPEKMSREYILALAKLKWPIDEDERVEAVRQLKEFGWTDDSVREDFLRKLYGPKMRP